MATGYLLQLRAWDPLAVIGYPHLPAAWPKIYLNAAGLGIEGVFY
jgi:hypothetical protein